MAKGIINLDKRAKGKGFRNFTSFVFIRYYDNGRTLEACAKELLVSRSRIRGEIIKRGWPLRPKWKTKRPFPKKRNMNINEKVAINTPFIFPWCAIYYYYNKCLLTTYEIARILKISQSSVIKLMRKFKIKRRNPGRIVNNGS